MVRKSACECVNQRASASRAARGLGAVVRIAYTSVHVCVHHIKQAYMYAYDTSSRPSGSPTATLILEYLQVPRYSNTLKELRRTFVINKCAFVFARKQCIRVTSMALPCCDPLPAAGTRVPSARGGSLVERCQQPHVFGHHTRVDVAACLQRLAAIALVVTGGLVCATIGVVTVPLAPAGLSGASTVLAVRIELGQLRQQLVPVHNCQHHTRNDVRADAHRQNCACALGCSHLGSKLCKLRIFHGRDVLQLLLRRAQFMLKCFLPPRQRDKSAPGGHCRATSCGTSRAHVRT